MKELDVCYFSITAMELPSLSRGVSALHDKGCEMRVRASTQTQLFDDARVASFVNRALRADAVIFTYHSGHDGNKSCPAFDRLTETVRLRRASGVAVPYLHIQPVGGDEEALPAAREHSDGVADGRWQTLFRYLSYGGPVNMESALAYLHASLRGTRGPISPPTRPAQEGIYHPDLPHLPDPERYIAERIDPGKPTIGVWFFQTLWMHANLAHIDAIIHEIEKRGANVLPVFSMRLKDSSLGNRGSDEIVQSYFMAVGRPRIDVLINTMSMSMTLTSSDYHRVFPDLGVPVLQAMSSSVPHVAWKESLQGMSTMDVTYHAAQPEFDGNLITVPVATREEDTIDPVTGGLLARFVPIPDRVSAIVSLALKWAGLRRKPYSDKRIAIVFHHYPPRNDRIGCAVGLDSFAAVKHLLDRMADEGYQIDHLYADGDELADTLLKRMTCDRRWLTADRLAERAEASAGRDLYLPWHEALPPPVRDKMVHDWGQVPGELFTHRNILYFSGLLNGHVFLTIQPPPRVAGKPRSHFARSIPLAAPSLPGPVPLDARCFQGGRRSARGETRIARMAARQGPRIERRVLSGPLRHGFSQHLSLHYQRSQ